MCVFLHAPTHLNVPSAWKEAHVVQRFILILTEILYWCMLFKAYALFLKAACVNKKHNKRIKATAIHVESCCWDKHDGKTAFSPPANSCRNMLVFTHNISTCLSQISPSSYPPPFSRPYLPNNSSFLLRWWTFWVIYNNHTFQAAASFFYSPPQLLFFPFSVLPLLPPVFLSVLSRVCRSSPADTCEGDLELSMVRHQPEGLDQLQAQTQFTRKELQSLYRGFKNVCRMLQYYLECRKILNYAK